MLKGQRLLKREVLHNLVKQQYKRPIIIGHISACWPLILEEEENERTNSI